MKTNDGFVPITAIFYAVFHPIQGTKIVHQVPEDAIGGLSEIEAHKDILFNFDTVKNYVIPKPQLCNRLVSFKIKEYRVVGYPVNIEGSRYSRNSFNFNFCFVFPYSANTTPYESAISRMGKMFHALEEQSNLLSKLDKDRVFFSKDYGKMKLVNGIEYTPGHEHIQKILLLSIESLIHQVFQDLNNYSECCIPIDSATSVDIKLFPMLPPPVDLLAYQVPILTVKLYLFVDVACDPTMIRILPYINGVNSVRRISELADAEFALTKQCIQHLMHYQCIILVDIFQFGNIYAPTNHVGDFLRPNGMAEECQAYVVSTNSLSDFNSLMYSSLTPQSTATPVNASSSVIPSSSINPSSSLDASSFNPSSSVTALGAKNSPLVNSSQTPASSSPYLRGALNNAGGTRKRFEIKIPSKATLFYLYRLLSQGQTLKEWYIQHQKQLQNIDIRRFVNFGVVRGIIYRVHTYPVLESTTRAIENSESVNGSVNGVIARLERGLRLSKERRELTNIKTVIVDKGAGTISKQKRSVSFNYRVGDNRKYSSDILSEASLRTDNANLDVFESESEESYSSDEFEPAVPLKSVLETKESSFKSGTIDDLQDLKRLAELLKDFQHFDSICTDLQKPRAEVERLLDRLGEYSLINA